MIRYETLFIAVPEITTDEASRLEKVLEKSVNQEKGAVISFERWGKYRLAYPIRTFDYGVYYLMRFEIDDVRKDTLLKDLKTIFSVKLEDVVMRNIMHRLEQGQSLEYKRPESLEEAPSKDIDTIMKESKNILGPRYDRGPKENFEKAPLYENEGSGDEFSDDSTSK